MASNEVHELYEGDVVLEFDPGKHRYTANGKPVPGTTSITGMVDNGKSNALTGWAAKMAAESIREKLEPGQTVDEISIESMVKYARWAHKRTMGTAGDIGTAVHDWIERHIKAQLNETKRPDMPVNARVRNGVEAYLEWERKEQPTYLYSEKKVFSKEWWYAGTADIVAETDKDGLVVADVKTSKYVYDSHWWQIAAYQKALEEEFDETFADRLIVKVSKRTGKVKVRRASNRRAKGSSYEDDLRVFQSARVIYKTLKGV